MPQEGVERWQAGGPSTIGALADFEEHLAATHACFALRRTRPRAESFASTVTRSRFGGLALVDVSMTPCAVKRGRRELASQDGVIGVQLILAGRERMAQGATSALLGPGEAIVWDSNRPVEDVEVLVPLVKRTLILPRDLAQSVLPRLDRVAGIQMDSSTSAPARLFINYINVLANELPDLDRGGREASARAALELLRGALLGTFDQGRDARRLRICDYIEHRLADPTLKPRRIADAHSISLRTLYEVFADQPETISARIRRRRLERCRQDLQHLGTGSVTEVAYRWGFRDAAHFSRAFRKQFGLPPSEIRENVLKGPPYEA